MKKSLQINRGNNKFSYYTLDELFKGFNTSINGLSNSQVIEIRNIHGENNIITDKNNTYLNCLKRAFINPFTSILFVLALISLCVDIIIANKPNPTTAIIITTMIILSGVIRLYQEIRAKNSSEKLEKSVHSLVTVKREGILIQIPSKDIVLGDIVVVKAGDRIPADLRFISTNNLFVSQAAITGESLMLEKKCERFTYHQDVATIQFENLAFAGSSVISGRGEGIVIAVGHQTLYGGVTFKSDNIDDYFYNGANSIANVMIKFMLILAPIVFIITALTKGNLLQAFIFSLSVAVGLTPEMLPMVITTCLAKGGISMSKKKTIIKNINAMQGFGSIDILCMDKTGTITNEEILLEYYLDILGNEDLRTLDYAYLNSLFQSGISNPIDKAILKCKNMMGKEAHFDQLKGDYYKIDEIPFDYERKSISTLIEDKEGNKTLVVKGEVEQVVSRCSSVLYKDETLPITDDGLSSVWHIVNDMLEEGMKVIAVAIKEVNTKDSVDKSDESNLTLIGYIGFFDAPKKTAKQSIKALKELNIKTKIITGDNRKIAISICKRVGINTESIVIGKQLDNVGNEELLSLVEKADVFAEITPEQKARIVIALKDRGHTVGFLGDGINDLPALCASDVGISVDTAVDEAKDISDVVLLEKDLNVLQEGIIEGRKIFTNMIKYIKITASSNFGNIFAIVCASAFLPFLPMASIQLLLLNLLYDVLCIILPWDNVDTEECKFPREWSSRNLGRFMRFFGSISSIFDIITFAFLYFILCPKVTGGLLFHQIDSEILRTQYIAIFQTGWFLESMWTQVLIIQMLRTKKTSFIESKSSLPVIIVTILGICTFTLITFMPFSKILGMTILPMWYFIFLFIIVILYMLSTTIGKRHYIKKYGELL